MLQFLKHRNYQISSDYTVFPAKYRIYQLSQTLSSQNRLFSF
nr:MAG TPA: hypothetical protein [Caudoviricetes sp.]